MAIFLVLEPFELTTPSHMQEEYIPVQLKQQGGGSFMYELSSRIFYSTLLAPYYSYLEGQSSSLEKLISHRLGYKSSSETRNGDPSIRYTLPINPTNPAHH